MTGGKTNAVVQPTIWGRPTSPDPATPGDRRRDSPTRLIATSTPARTANTGQCPETVPRKRDPASPCGAPPAASGQASSGARWCRACCLRRSKACRWLLLSSRKSTRLVGGEVHPSSDRRRAARDQCHDGVGPSRRRRRQLNEDVADVHRPDHGRDWHTARVSDQLQRQRPFANRRGVGDVRDGELLDGVLLPSRVIGMAVLRFPSTWPVALSTICA